MRAGQAYEIHTGRNDCRGSIGALWEIKAAGAVDLLLLCTLESVAQT